MTTIADLVEARVDWTREVPNNVWVGFSPSGRPLLLAELADSGLDDPYGPARALQISYPLSGPPVPYKPPPLVEARRATFTSTTTAKATTAVASPRPVP